MARRAMALMVVVYLVLGVAYSLVNPVFESPDEALNYANIRFFVAERRLPVMDPGKPTKAHHPPLYYVLGALATFWVPDENLTAIVEQGNPFWAYRLSEPGADNKSLYLHDPDFEGFPYRDTALGVHLMRWLSLLLGVGTVLCVYTTARELFPRRATLAIGAAALVAFNPMFVFISSSVHDDPLANLVAAAMLCVAARVLMRGATVRRAAVLGVLAGLAILTKLTSLLVVPTVALALVYRVLADRGRAGWGEVLRLGGVFALVTLLVGGWWFVRNLALYGEPTSMVSQTGVWGVRHNAPDLVAAARELGFAYDSFWGVFGYGQIPMPSLVYGVLRLLGFVAVGGLVLAAVRRGTGRALWDPAPAALLIVASAPAVVIVVNFARMTVSPAADFGRYWFVSLAALAPLCALGLSEWCGRTSAWPIVGLAGLMLVLAVYALVGVLWPAYAPPAMHSTGDIQAGTQLADVRFGERPGGAIRLIGYDLDRNRVLPGDEATVTLCWEAIAPVEENYVYFVHLIGPEESKAGARDTHPGLGRYPTSRWKPGDAFCDAVRVPIEEWAQAPAVYDVAVGWYLYDENQMTAHLPAYDRDGAPLELVTLTKVKVAPQAYAAVEVPNWLDADLGQVTLLGFDVDKLEAAPGESVDVTLYWMAQSPVPVDYTVFVHLAAAEGPPHAQDDVQPQRGAYPTSFWDVGEVVADPHTILIPSDLPEGEYPVVAGMYLLETGERLSEPVRVITLGVYGQPAPGGSP